MYQRGRDQRSGVRVAGVSAISGLWWVTFTICFVLFFPKKGKVKKKAKVKGTTKRCHLESGAAREWRCRRDGSAPDAAHTFAAVPAK
jgi:hypothetical protein